MTSRDNAMRKNGFTLVEVLVGVVVGLIIVAGVYGVMVLTQRTSASLGRRVVTQQDTRLVLDFMASEIRMASFNPSMSGDTWTNLTTTDAIDVCSNVKSVIAVPTPTAANRGILYADANNLFIAMDLGPEGSPPTYGIIGDADNEFIFYSYNAATSAVRRSISCGTNQAILGGDLPGTRIYNNATSPSALPLFQYFDRTGAELTGTINIPAIRRIRINIAAETKDVDTATQQRKKMIYSTDVLVRNHAVFMPNF